MLKSYLVTLLGAAVLMGMLTACGGGGGGGADQQITLQSVHIVNKGSEVVPGASVTDFAPGKLSYNLTGMPVAHDNLKFDAVLATEDFDRLATLVAADNLTKTLGEPGSYDSPACRHLGYDIEIKRSDATYRFTIPGTQVCGSAARAGLLDLLRLQNELVAKYTPKAGG